jgi:hypothetical protein
LIRTGCNRRYDGIAAAADVVVEEEVVVVEGTRIPEGSWREDLSRPSETKRMNPILTAF